jgi:tartrate-resistant acid phosphatase type 5
MRVFVILASFSLLAFYSGNTQPKIFEQAALDDGHKICVVGDTGMGNLAQELVADAMEANDCDQVHIMGDIIYDTGIRKLDDPRIQTHFLKPYESLLRNTPIYLALGNHDYLLGKPSLWIQIAKEHHNVEMPSQYYAHLYEDVCLITMDTNAFFFQQQDWFEAHASKWQACEYVITLAHHPIISSGKHGNAHKLRMKFFKKTVLPYADAHIAGHDHHLSDEGVYKNVHHFVSGAGAKLRGLKRKPKVWGASKLGFMMITVERDEGLRLKYDFITVEKQTGQMNNPQSGYLQKRAI